MGMSLTLVRFKSVMNIALPEMSNKVAFKK